MINTKNKVYKFSNFIGLITLIIREKRRFTSIWTQTLLAPIVTSGLFVLVFSVVFMERVGEPVSNINYSLFLAPGILMMVTVQNAFANTSTSILVSKVNGNIVDTLMPPLSALELTIGFMTGGILRGVFVASGVMIVIFPIVGLLPKNILLLIFIVLLGCMQFSLMGILVGIYCNKFDQMSAVNNFLLTPLTFLSGTFYSVNRLPNPLDSISLFNPVFWLMDSIRYAAIGQLDSNLYASLAGMALVNIVLFYCVWRWFAGGFYLKS
jgi:ABC-2 type transport system permease protein